MKHLTNEEVILILLDEGYTFNEKKNVFTLSLNDDEDIFMSFLLENSKEIFIGFHGSNGKNAGFIPYDRPKDQFMTEFRNFMYRSL